MTAPPDQIEAVEPSGDTASLTKVTARVVPTGRPVEGLTALPSPESPESRFARTVLQGLRGRYLLVIVCSLIVGGLCGAAGWVVGRPVYQSESLLRIAYTLPEVRGKNDLNEPLPMFSEFMASQRMLIASRTAIDVAAQDPVWRSFGQQPPERPDQYFADHLIVSIKPRSEYISIAVEDYDPTRATAGVRAITAAYQELYKAQSESHERQRTGILQVELAKLEQEIGQAENDLRLKAVEYGTTRQDMLQDAAAAQLARIKVALADIGLAKATAEASAGPDAASAPASQPTSSQPAASDERARLTPEQIAVSDFTMRRYLDEQERAQSYLESLKRTLGPAHKARQLAEQGVEDAQGRVERYVELHHQLEAMKRNTGEGLNSVRAAGLAGLSLNSLNSAEKKLTKLSGDILKEMGAIENRRLELQQIEGRLAKRRSDYDALKNRIATLDAERSLGGRLSVVSPGQVPLSPTKDPRFRLAAAGGLAGAFFPAAALLALTLRSRRYRYSDEAEPDSASGIPLLGILPELQSNESDPDQALAASHSLHQLRVSIQARSPRSGSSIYLVTSATAAEGKTSLAMSLALSFAAARLRTLIIDADMVGRHLTDACQATDLPGFQEALAGVGIRDVVRMTYSGLYVLSAGRSGSKDACAISESAARNLLAQARVYFNVVIVDSGPILGSMEAAVLSQIVDGVIFTISRGQQRGLVQSALRRLDSLGASVVGCVFNRASGADFRSSPYGSSSRASRIDPDEGAAVAARLNQLTLHSPLVRAVASAIPGN